MGGLVQIDSNGEEHELFAPSLTISSQVSRDINIFDECEWNM